MGQYGEVAVEAVRLIVEEMVSPLRAWNLASTSIIASVTSKKKGCPRKAFLGLCGAGLLNVPFKKDFDIDDAIKSNNGQYAITAVNALRTHPELATSKRHLWINVLQSLKFEIDKKHNGQMDVIVSLWQKNYIVK